MPCCPSPSVQGLSGAAPKRSLLGDLQPTQVIQDSNTHPRERISESRQTDTPTFTSSCSRTRLQASEKVYNPTEENLGDVLGSARVSFLVVVSRRGCSDLPKKFDPGEGVRPPGLYDLDISVERRQPIEERARDGRSVRRTTCAMVP